MKSWVLIKKGVGCWGLYIRDYACQGVNPDYTLFKEISEACAWELANSGLADDLYGSLPK